MADRTEGEAVKALEAVSHDLYVEGEVTFSGVTPSMSEADYATEWIVRRWLDSLLGDIPEEAVEAAGRALAAELGWAQDPDAVATKAVDAFLRSLRTNLAD